MKSLAEIEERALELKISGDWVGLVELLLVVRGARLYRQDHQSFTRWVRDFSRRSAVSEFFLWRAIGAREFAVEIEKEHRLTVNCIVIGERVLFRLRSLYKVDRESALLLLRRGESEGRISLAAVEHEIAEAKGGKAARFDSAVASVVCESEALPHDELVRLVRCLLSSIRASDSRLTLDQALLLFRSKSDSLT